MAVAELLLQQTEVASGESLKERLVLGVQIKPENPVDKLGRALPDGLPAVLVFSEAAGKEYQSGQFKNLRLRYEELLSRGDQTGFTVTVEDMDSLAIGNADQDGVRIQLDEVGKYVKFDPEKQRLGLKIITGEEGKNTIRDFWAEQFIINIEDETAELIETRTGLELIVGQVKRALEEHGLNQETGRSGHFGLALQVVQSKRYVLNYEYGENNSIEQGFQLPILLVLDRGITTEIVGDLSASEEVSESIWAETHTLSVSRTSQSGTKDRLIWCDVESDDSGRLTLKDIYKDYRYSVTDMGQRGSDGSAVRCLAFLCQGGEVRGEQMLKLTPVSVELTADQFKWLRSKGSLPSLMDLEKERMTVNQVATGEEEEVDLGENFSEEDFNLFNLMIRVLGGDKQELVREGIIGGKRQALWMNKGGNPVIKGSAWKAGYFDNRSPSWAMSDQKDGKVVTTHIVVEINGVSGKGLADNRLRSASNTEDGVAVKIYVLPDQTIKVDIGGQVKKLKESVEKQLWQTVLAGMKVGRSEEKKILYQAQTRKEDSSRRRQGRHGHYHR